LQRSSKPENALSRNGRIRKSSGGSIFTFGAPNQLLEEIIAGFFNGFENDMQLEKIHAQRVFAMRATKLWFIFKARDRFLKID
jgi:hypothetical protein